MTETSDTKRLHPTSPSAPDLLLLLRRRRRRRCLCACLLVLLIVIIVVVALSLTVFRARDPTTELVSATLTGVAPRVTLPALQIRLNVTLSLVERVHNPNRAAFRYGVGHTALSYRGAQVGEAEVEPGRIPDHGSGLVRMALTVEADRLAGNLGELVEDVAAGEVGLDTETRIPGRVIVLGFIKLHAVAVSRCHVVVGIPDLKVRSQVCSNKTKL